MVLFRMDREVKLSNVHDALADLSYPVDRTDAAAHLEEYTLKHAGGEENLGKLVAETHLDSYDSAEDLESELHNVLPVDAVGEPGQSEGEG